MAGMQALARNNLSSLNTGCGEPLQCVNRGNKYLSDVRVCPLGSRRAQLESFMLFLYFEVRQQLRHRQERQHCCQLD